MTYQLVQNLGWHLIPYAIACGISWLLLQHKFFKGHLVYLAALGVLTVLSALFPQLGEVCGRSLVFLLVVCAWDHYWARARLGAAPLNLEKTKKLQIALAVVLSGCWLLCLFGVGFFRYFEEEIIFVAAVFLWAYGYFHKDSKEGKPPY